MMRKKFLFCCLSVLLIALFFVLSSKVYANESRNLSYKEYDYVEDEIIVCLPKDSEPEWIKNNILEISQSYSVLGAYDNSELQMLKPEEIKKLDYPFMLCLKLKEEYSVESALDYLTELPGVVWADKNYLYYPDSMTTSLNDTNIEDEWYLDQCNFERAWDIVDENEHNQVTIAVIDGGFRIDLQEIQDVMLVEKSVDVTQYGEDQQYLKLVDSNQPYLINSIDVNHGTFCMGIIAAKANNSFGIAGAARGWENDLCKIMAIKASSTVSSTRRTVFAEDDLFNATEYAVKNGADVISMSISGPTNNNVLLNMANYAYKYGVVFVASAGNNNNSMSRYPASYWNVISVGGTDQYDHKAGFSSYGSDVDITAPAVGYTSLSCAGDDVLAPNGEGTSYATPLVASAAALMLSVDPALRPLEVKTILQNSATNISDYLYSSFFAHGRLDAGRALELSIEDRDQIITHQHTFLTRGYTFTCDECGYSCLQPICVTCGEHMICNRIRYTGGFFDLGCPSCGAFYFIY